MRGLLLLRDRETLNFTNVSLQLWHTTLGKGTVLTLATPHLGVVVHSPLVRAQAQPAASHRKKVGILVTFSFPEFLVWIVPCNDQRLSICIFSDHEDSAPDVSVQDAAVHQLVVLHHHVVVAV